MTIPTREDALKALDILKLGRDVGNRQVATLRSYIESHTGEVVAWRWPSPELGGGYWLTEQRDAVPADKVAEPLFASPVQPDATVSIGDK